MLGGDHSMDMYEPPVTKAELLAAWRDAVRAAEMAERLASVAAEAASQADLRAAVSGEIAELAERTAELAQRAAERARAVAIETATLAKSLHEEGVSSADGTLNSAKGVEADAQAAYHARPDGDPPGPN